MSTEETSFWKNGSGIDCIIIIIICIVTGSLSLMYGEKERKEYRLLDCEGLKNKLENYYDNYWFTAVSQDHIVADLITKGCLK